MNKHISVSRMAAAAFLAARAFADGAAQPSPEDLQNAFTNLANAAPQDLLKAFNGLVNAKDAVPAAVSNAYATVLAHDGLNANQCADVVKGFIAFHTKKSLFGEAVAIADSVASVTNLPVARRADNYNTVASASQESNFRDAFGSYHTRGIDRAYAIYEKILAIPDATDLIKVEAYRNMANALLESQHKADDALALLDKALALPGLGEEAKARATANKAGVLARNYQREAAIALYKPLVDLQNLNAGFRADVALKVSDLIKAASWYGDANKYLSDVAAKYPGLISESTLNDRLGAQAKRNSIWAQLDKYEKGNPPDVVGLMRTYGDESYDALAANLPKIVSSTEKKVPSRLGSIFWEMSREWASMKAVRDPRFAALYVQTVESVAVSNRPPAADIFKFIRNSVTVADAAAKYGRMVIDAPAEAKIPRDVAEEAVAAVAVHEAKGNAGRAVAFMRDWLAKNPAADKVAEASFMLRGVKRAMLVRDEAVAKGIYAECEKLFRKEGPRSLKCPFVKDAPQEIPEILASAFYKNGEKGLLDRKFGDDLKFIIETDVTAHRSVTEFNGKAFRPTELFAFCDQYGVKILLREFVDGATLASFRAGFGGLGGYEAYLATGFDAPYTFLEFDPSTRAISDGFVCQYNNGTGYRNLVSADGSLSIKNYLADDSAVTLISAAWSKEFNALPANGGKWYFEPLNWQNGGWSWGGSKSVHNRSSFGALVFDGLTPEAITAIKRVILPKAAAAFRSARSANNGCIEIWKDPELGDPAFYEACIVPLETRLAAGLGKVNAGMTDAEVNEVFDGFAKEWLNIEYIVSRLRTRYLSAKRMSE